MAKASIILPTYNGAAYLARAIESCLDQSEKRIELIIVDDGSTDSTETLVKYYLNKDKRIKYIKIKNSGTANAMNVGCKAAESSVLMFAASDDIQLPNKVKIGLQGIKKTDFFYSGYYHCNPNGQVWQFCPPKRLTKKNIIKCDCASGGSFVMTKKLWHKIPYRDLKSNEDLGMLVDIYNLGMKTSFVRTPTYKYCLLPTGISYSRKDEVDKLTQELIKELK